MLFRSSLLGSDVGREVPTLYYAIPELIRDYPRITKALLEEVNEAGVLSLENRLAELKDLLGLEADSQPAQLALKTSIEQLEARIQERTLVPLDDNTLHHLQEQANRFYRLRLISERVNVADVTHSLRMRQNWSY